MSILNETFFINIFASEMTLQFFIPFNQISTINILKRTHFNTYATRSQEICSEKSRIKIFFTVYFIFVYLFIYLSASDHLLFFDTENSPNKGHEMSEKFIRSEKWHLVSRSAINKSS